MYMEYKYTYIHACIHTHTHTHTGNKEMMTISRKGKGEESSKPDLRRRLACPSPTTRHLGQTDTHKSTEHADDLIQKGQIESAHRPEPKPGLDSSAHKDSKHFHDTLDLKRTDNNTDVEHEVVPRESWSSDAHGKVSVHTTSHSMSEEHMHDAPFSGDTQVLSHWEQDPGAIKVKFQGMHVGKYRPHIGAVPVPTGGRWPNMPAHKGKGISTTFEVSGTSDKVAPSALRNGNGEALDAQYYRKEFIRRSGIRPSSASNMYTDEQVHVIRSHSVSPALLTHHHPNNYNQIYNYSGHVDKRRPLLSQEENHASNHSYNNSSNHHDGNDEADSMYKHDDSRRNSFIYQQPNNRPAKHADGAGLNKLAGGLCARAQYITQCTHTHKYRQFATRLVPSCVLKIRTSLT